ncbi:hypothetical protein [Sphaerisporangium dianthi]|uniref:Uncharacterized protein n=1 Tax=Sphaerisporangium dianthi TaxID=1436120 RepID=A0ABV9CA18_9ACTN
MTESPDEYGEVLRRVLRAEADSVVPSAEGLQIIRTRIEQRGVRGIFWWRAAASAFGAVLVAATVVMVVPGLRERLDIDQQPIVQVQYDTSPPDESSTRRPWNGGHSPAVVGSQRPQPTTSAGETPATAPTPSVTTSPGNDCVTAPPTTVEPEAGDSPQPCAEPTSTESQPDQTTEPRPTPTRQSGTPTPTRTATSSPKPTVEQPTPTASQAPSDPPEPTASPLMTTEADTDTDQTATQE